MVYRIKNISLYYIVATLLQSCSQNSIAGTSAETSGLHNALTLYHASLSPETGLYNGSEYAYNAYYPFIINQGHPFFKSPNFDTGAVFYDNVLYQNVALLYDIIKGELLTHDPTNNYILRLNTEKVRWFTLSGNTFIKLNRGNSNADFRTGFYNILYNGNIALYKRISKKFNENSSSFQGINKYVVESNEYFIKKDNQYYTVDNKKSLLAIVNDKKKELGQFMKKNTLSLRKAKEESLVKIAAYLDAIYNHTTKPVNQ